MITAVIDSYRRFLLTCFGEGLQQLKKSLLSPYSTPFSVLLHFFLDLISLS